MAGSLGNHSDSVKSDKRNSTLHCQSDLFCHYVPVYFVGFGDLKFKFILIQVFQNQDKSRTCAQVHQLWTTDI